MKLLAGTVLVSVTSLVGTSLAAMTFLVAGLAAPGTLATGTIAPSPAAIDDIGPWIDTYVDAAATCPGLPWTVLAGIGKVESDHGRHGGRTVAADGTVTPPLIGIALDGTNGTARIVDTDNGALDRDAVYDRAVGPMQFIPATWHAYGLDANGDGRVDPHNLVDAVHAAAALLCSGGPVEDLRAAVFNYNRSSRYVDDVLDWAARYTGTITGHIVGTMALPVPRAVFETTPDRLVRPHHDYPALDVGVPVGTPVFAVGSGSVVVSLADSGRCGGTVIIASDGYSTTYCHLPGRSVAAGEVVVAGQQIGLSGGAVGAPGAGNTTGPHLHLSIDVVGRTVCPQPVMLAIYRGGPIHPSAAPPTGCVTGGVVVDWGAWLDTSNYGLAVG